MSNLIARGTVRKRYPILEAGAYLARCYAIIDIGDHYDNPKVVFMWELPTETIDVDGKEKPRAISETYTLSLSDKANMRKMLENWRGRAFTDEEIDGFDLENVLGKPCMVNVIHKIKQNGEPFAKVGGVNKLPKGMEVPPLVNPKKLFSLKDVDALDAMKELPEWIQNRIRESSTYRDMITPPGDGTQGTDDFSIIDDGDGDILF